MKKIFLLITIAFCGLPTFADDITDGISIAGDHVYAYTPYVQTLGYVLAAIIGIAGAFSVYLAYINNAPNIRKRMITWGCSSMAMLCMTIALPQFFAYQESGLQATTFGSTTGKGSGSQAGGDTYSTIDTSIPGLDDSRWSPDDRYTTVQVGNIQSSVANVLSTIYSKAGGGAEGSYGRTLSYITQLYRQGAMDEQTYRTLLTSAGNLPHT